jgi:perosamine synthetase
MAKNGQEWKIVEDMAEVHGLVPHPDTDAACWSFYKNKIVAGEEGGAVYFKDRPAAERARELRTLGFNDSHDFFHRPRGHNYRLANCLAEKITKSLAQFEANLLARKNIEAIYDSHCPSENRMPPREVPWVYDIRVRGSSFDAQYELVHKLNQAGIPARHGFKPMTHQTEYDNFKACTNGLLHVAGLLASEIIYLPIRPGVTTEMEVEQAFEIIKR